MKLELGYGFRCVRCGKCCISPPTVTKKDIQNIAGYLNISFKDFIKKYCRYFNGKRGEIKKVNGKCVFFKDNGCSIYKVRPIICRFRPYSIQFKNNELVITYDKWFLENCKGLFKGELIDEDSLRYYKLVLKYLGVEKAQY
ncbi:YkgJ family cysteine cluster protein [Methanocaldococcus indicus]|uniref:YkgJ family cysteine cluster protein n=1 Tax=Methanocaldococcus indicus TaxID=213231 RepID=UPI003C6D68F4